MGIVCHRLEILCAASLTWAALVAGARAQQSGQGGSFPPKETKRISFPSDDAPSMFDTAERRSGPLDRSIAAEFAGESNVEPLYVVTPPRWQPGDVDWLDRHPRIAADAFDDHRVEAVPSLPAPPSSLWQRWRQRRQELRRQPGTWMRYPLYFEKFTGVINVNEPVHDLIHHGVGNLFGGRWGWDVAPRWGAETRLGYVRATLNDTLHPLIPAHENFLFWDADLMFYPFGDTKWRPFAMLGMGLVDLGYIDDHGREWHQQLITMPFAVGVKYRLNNLNALRLDVTDNVIFGSNQGGNGEHVMHNISVLFAFERRFGLPHRSYFPRREMSKWARFRNWLATMEY
ncbi:MAG TPA: hypothetical protein VF306_09585 [Pirellulales bacterium]